jgi:peptidoglycan/LPS O-acetylase OafA/YrhL
MPWANHYRADIDGLRALCIFAVLGFHAQLTGFSGGYIGVDAFFVISGFLITRILVPEDRIPRISLGDFYLRRVRRIAPALLLILVVTATAAVLLLLPWDLKLYGRFSGYSSVLLANFAAWNDFGYFTRTDMPRPLLHLWSIAVEEQFYLLYPLALIVSARFAARHLVVLIALAALASFVVCVWGSYHSPSFTFFMAPMRAWELLCGALLALGVLPEVRRRGTAEAISIVALATLAFAIVGYDSQTRYPGLNAVPVCLATVAIIAAGAQPTWVTRVLSLRPVVFTGLISYSLYLWHLPIFSFAQYNLIEAPSTTVAWLLIVVCYALAVLTWKTFERPMRNGTLLPSNRVFLAAMFVAFAALGGFGWMLWNSDGYPKRFSKTIQAITSDTLGYHAEAIPCLRLPLGKVETGELCSFGVEHGAASVVVWGDSHVSAALYSYEELAKTNNVKVWHAARSACRPVLLRNEEISSDELPDSCHEFNRAMLAAITKLDPQVVILQSYWMSPVSGPRRDTRIAADERNRLLRLRLESTLRLPELTSRTVCVVRDAPILAHDPTYLMAISELRGYDARKYRISARVAQRQDSLIEEVVAPLLAGGRVLEVDLKRPLCATGMCEFSREGLPLYIDTHHLSSVASLIMIPELQQCFAPLRSSR